MPLRHVALVIEKSKVKPAEVARVASALQKQVARDFAAVWNVRAKVDSFVRLEDVPLGHWPVIVQEEVPDAVGYHDDQDGQPFALVRFDRDWPLTASHEVLEMLADPFGRRLMTGNSPDPKQGRVAFLVEVCDPCEDAAFGYAVDGILVSDFYTPEYFEPRKIAGKQYSHTGAIEGPREVLKGGYLSWMDPATRHWFQLQRFTSKTKIVDLGAKTGSVSLRSWSQRGRRPGDVMGKRNDETQRQARARALRTRIGRLKSGSGSRGANPPGGASPGPESPHQFVERRMREIAAEKRRAAARGRAATRTGRTKSEKRPGKKG